jgi:ribose/xylose/arabinose/galactoside ABC-type transport system permease subunit
MEECFNKFDKFLTLKKCGDIIANNIHSANNTIAIINHDGGNPMASFHSGINIKRVTFIGFLIGGFTAGLAGSLTTSMTSGASPLANPHLALEAISAVILGGASVHGGKGRISGTILGFLILGSISNGLSLANVASYHQMIFKGIMLVVAVAFDVIRENKRRSLVLYS